RRVLRLLGRPWKRLGRSRHIQRSPRLTRGSAAHGREPFRVRGDQPPNGMTVTDLVDRERGRLSRLIAAAGGAGAIGVAALLLAAGVIVLGRARWIDLPRVVPFIVWLAVI